MDVIINGKRYNTDTAEIVLSRSWHSYHPNQGGGDPKLFHVRSIYRTKKGILFAYQFDHVGYGRDRNGLNGLFIDEKEEITPLSGDADAIATCEHFGFSGEEVAKHFEVEDA